MDYILLNEDGSIKKTNFMQVIQQNNDGVNEIFIAAEGRNESGYSVTGVFVLPDGTVSEEAGTFEEDYEYAEGKTADGWVITITQNETKLAGLVFLTLRLKETATNKTLYSFRATLTINATADQASLTLITLAQYNNLKDYFDSYLSDIENKVPYTGATEDLDLGSHELKFGSDDSSRIFEDETGLTVINDFGAIILIPHTYLRVNTYIVSNSYELYGMQAGLGKGVDNSITLYNNDGDIIVDCYGQFKYKDYEVATHDDLPKKNVIGTFNTSDFSTVGDVKQISVPLSDYMANSDLLIITWGNCFAICPVPVSGAGRVVAALWNANGEAQTTRIRYELTNSNQNLQITLPASFQLPANFTGYIIDYKIV